MTRVVLVSSEPIRPRMAGIGIRYAELARRLPGFGVDVRLLSPSSPDEMRAVVGEVDARRFVRGAVPDLVEGCSAAVAQGYLANDLLVEAPGLPVAIDLYDPWLVENLSYAEQLGSDPFRNDHATWVLQLSRGDFFLCSSDEQRTFYLGFLLALGRVNPDRWRTDPDCQRLIATVPFGIPDRLPPRAPVLPRRAPGEKRILFGGLYDWYDPFTLIRALDRLDPGVTALFIRNPNPDTTPQGLLSRLERHCREKGLWGTRVRLLDWVPSERRYDLLRDVDVLAAPHLPSLETSISLRTRLLDALAAGCPVVATEGGAMSRLLREHGAGWVVPAEDDARLAAALGEALGGPLSEERKEGARRLLVPYAWPEALAPLVAFLGCPRTDETKDRYAFRPAVSPPPEGPIGRARRWARRRVRALAGRA